MRQILILCALGWLCVSAEFRVRSELEAVPHLKVENELRYWKVTLTGSGSYDFGYIAVLDNVQFELSLAEVVQEQHRFFLTMNLGSSKTLAFDLSQQILKIVAEENKLYFRSPEDPVWWEFGRSGHLRAVNGESNTVDFGKHGTEVEGVLLTPFTLKWTNVPVALTLSFTQSDFVIDKPPNTTAENPVCPTASVSTVTPATILQKEEQASVFTSAFIGAAIGIGVALIVFVVFLTVFFCRRRRTKSRATSADRLPRSEQIRSLTIN